MDPHRARGIVLVPQVLQLRPDGTGLRLHIEGVSLGLGGEAVGQIGSGSTVSIAAIEATRESRHDCPRCRAWSSGRQYEPRQAMG